jgi:hypothetical protein
MMLDEWRRSILVPILMNKGDVQSCTNYQGIKLMSHTMKLWERIMLKESYQRHQKPIWFYAREIDYGGDLLDKATYGEI